LHLVKPLGFSLDDRRLRRAGLDYWDEVKVVAWDSLQDMLAAAGRSFFLTTKCDRPYYEESFQPGDFLFFGRETKGLPESLLAERGSQLLTIPMLPRTRSLNLATAVAIVLFEGMRQIRSRA